MIANFDYLIKVDGNEYMISVEVDFYSELYGDDADGNRGIQMSMFDITDVDIRDGDNCTVDEGPLFDHVWSEVEQEIHERVSSEDGDFSMED